ncbi:MAG: RsiV family protein [Acidimicrobiia bacterium]
MTKPKPRLSLEPITVTTTTDPVLTATAQLPTLTGFATADADAAATAAARKIVTEFTDDFVTVFEGPDAMDVNRDAPLPTLELTTSLANTLDRFVSLRFEVYADYGGAHPESYVQSITFDAVSGRQLKLTDLATVQKGAVSRIANAAVDSIIEQMPDLKDFTTVDLTTPAESDWSAWFPERNGVRIVFSQGEAGPSAAGVIEVFIPWDTVTGVTGAIGPQ